jgi:hypothetical protein
LVTGGGIVLLTGPAEETRREFFLPVGLFGLAITTGLLAYEIYGIKKCGALISGGRALEKKMCDGQFIKRPDAVFKFVNEPFAAATVYPAVLGAWTYLALFFVNRTLGAVISLLVFLAGFLGILRYDKGLRKERQSCDPADR